MFSKYYSQTMACTPFEIDRETLTGYFSSPGICISSDLLS